MEFETVKKEGNNYFPDWKVCLAQAFFFGDSRLDMLISAMLIKKTYTALVYFKGIFLQVILVRIIVPCY